MPKITNNYDSCFVLDWNVVFYPEENTWLQLFENEELKGIFGRKKDEVINVGYYIHVKTNFVIYTGHWTLAGFDGLGMWLGWMK
jgi:hypothetical protein